MDNFSYMAKHSFFIKSPHIGVNKTFVLFLRLSNFLLSNKLSHLSKIISKNKPFEFLCFQGFVFVAVSLFAYLWITCS